MYKKTESRVKRLLLLVGVILAVWFYFCLPNPLFKAPYSTVLLSREGQLLSAIIAKDEQWRFPIIDSVPEKFEHAILFFEDEYFYSHPGINPGSIWRAIKQNLGSGKVLSGGSTITMQTIRLSRQGQARTFIEKLIEAVQAIRLELNRSKENILRLYVSHAPFGGNVVGLDAAAWRYFGRPADQLSWGETATLAVLPNAPALIFPGKNSPALLVKRNNLLAKLCAKGIIDEQTKELAQEEPLPGRPLALPQKCSHLMFNGIKQGKGGQIIRSTVNEMFQAKAEEIVEGHHRRLSTEEIENISALVIDVHTGEALTYIGNTKGTKAASGYYVDCANAKRSTGSIIKPFLYAGMLQEGSLLIDQLVLDIPTQYAGYAPKNFHRDYDGIVPAGNALSRSLNVPAVRLLRDYGVEKFKHKLEKMEFTTFDKASTHYGLSLILGGAEAKLTELAGAYASMARVLNNYPANNSYYKLSDFRGVRTFSEPTELNDDRTLSPVFSASSIYLTLEALSDGKRPRQEIGWENFNSSRRVGWKTGTSFGHRDAWSIGVTPEYVVAVWVGNADGEGRPGMTGLSAAAPIMFDLFQMLPQSSWFDPPHDEMITIEVCAESGFRKSLDCPNTQNKVVQSTGGKGVSCPYHEIIQLDQSGSRVTGDCFEVEKMISKAWFILPPVVEWFYKSKNPSYQPLPDFKVGCGTQEHGDAMQLVYPIEPAAVLIPRLLDGSYGKVVFEVRHRSSSAELFWYLDGEYMGTTNRYHQMEFDPEPGKYSLTIVDQNGEMIVEQITVLPRSSTDYRAH